MSSDDDLNISTSSQHDQYIDYNKLEERVKLLINREAVSSSAIKRLLAVLDKMTPNLIPNADIDSLMPQVPSHILDHNYDISNRSSGIYSGFSSSSSSPPPPSPQPPSSQPSSPPSSSSSRHHQTKSLNICSAKRKIIDNDQEYQEENVQMALPEEQQYPLKKGDEIILGPNGTEVNIKSYDSIIWSSAAAATRQLLGLVFSGDILATHSLTGKPSPAFYGRERPAKMQLDPIKTADIIHCVRSKFKCTQREIRAAITTKCSDTCKKYKRRQQKQLESTNAMD